MSLIGFVPRNHPQQVPSDDVDDRGTPFDLFASWHQRFRFTVDAAAAPHNAKLERHWTKEVDGLKQSWAGERVWCNPPYSSIWPWVRKAWSETDCPLVVMLLPANRTEQQWWQREVEPHRDRPGSILRTEFWRGRIKFLYPGEETVRPGSTPPFGCVLLVWDRQVAA